MIRKVLLIAAVAYVVSAADLPYAGRWKLNLEKSYYPHAARTIEFAQRGTDGITVRILDLNAICEAKFDGKDYPATGQGVPAGYTLAIIRTDARSFQMIQKMNGKALYTSTFTVSADAKTLTETDSANAVGEKVQAVYDRQ